MYCISGSGTLILNTQGTPFKGRKSHNPHLQRAAHAARWSSMPRGKSNLAIAIYLQMCRWVTRQWEKRGVKSGVNSIDRSCFKLFHRQRFQFFSLIRTIKLSWILPAYAKAAKIHYSCFSKVYYVGTWRSPILMPCLKTITGIVFKYQKQGWLRT
jgi:hypothetical protein